MSPIQNNTCTGFCWDNIDDIPKLPDDEILKLVNFKKRFIESDNKLISRRWNTEHPLCKVNLACLIRTAFLQTNTMIESGVYEFCFRNTRYLFTPKLKRNNVARFRFLELSPQPYTLGATCTISNLFNLSTGQWFVSKKDVNKTLACEEAKYIINLHEKVDEIAEKITEKYSSPYRILDNGKKTLIGIEARPILVESKSFAIKKYMDGDLLNILLKEHEKYENKLPEKTLQYFYQLLEDCLFGMVLLDEIGSASGGSIIHMDLKTQNIFVENGHAYIGDFDRILHIKNHENSPSLLNDETKFCWSKGFSYAPIIKNISRAIDSLNRCDFNTHVLHFRDFLAAQLVFNVLTGKSIVDKESLRNFGCEFLVEFEKNDKFISLPDELKNMIVDIVKAENRKYNFIDLYKLIKKLNSKYKEKNITIIDNIISILKRPNPFTWIWSDPDRKLFFETRQVKQHKYEKS